MPDSNNEDWGPDLFAEQVTILQGFYQQNQIPELPEESSVCSLDEIILAEARKLKKAILNLLENYARDL